MVPRQVDNALPRRLSKPLQRGEEVSVLGALDRQRCPILPISNLADLQEIEEVPCQDQLDRSLPASKFHEKSLELFRRLEPVAPRVPPDMRVRDKNDQGVVAEFKHLPKHRLQLTADS